MAASPRVSVPALLAPPPNMKGMMLPLGFISSTSLWPW